MINKRSDGDVADVSKVADIILRVSSVGQLQGYSLQDQERDARAYCERMAYVVNAVYDDGVAASATENRPGIQAALDDMRARRAGVIVIGKFDRLARDQGLGNTLRYQAKMYGARVESAHEPLPDDPILADKMADDYLFVAELERRHIRQRTQAGRRSRAESGKLMASAYPLYGYVWADANVKRGKTRYVPDFDTVDGNPDHAAARVVQRIFRDIARGVPIQAVCAQLEDEHVPTAAMVLQARGQYSTRHRYSELWRPATVRRMLANTSYVGRAVAYRWKTRYRLEYDEITGLERRVRERTTEDEHSVPLPPDVCPALVDEETAAAVRAQLERNKAESTRRNSDPEATLLRGGYIYCGYCGSKLYTNHIGGAWRYKCSTFRIASLTMKVCPSAGMGITASIIDEAVWRKVRTVLQHPDVIADAIARVRAETAQHDERTAAHAGAVAGQLAKLHTHVKNLTTGIADAVNAETRALLTHELDNVTEQIHKLTAERERLNTDTATRADHIAQLAGVEEWARIMAGRLDTLTYRQKRMALYALGAKVTVWRKGHEPRYTLTFDFEGLNASITNAMLPFDEVDAAGDKSVDNWW